MSEPDPRPGRPKIPFPAVAGGLVVLIAAVAAVRAAGLDGAPVPEPSTEATGSSSVISSPELEPLPRCRLGSKRAEQLGYDDWQLTLLDTRLRLPAGYEPPDLASVSEAGFSGGYRVRSFVIADLRALGRAAEASGNPIALAAAYRSFAQQSLLFGRRVAIVGEEEALAKTARPGHSEHQLGVAVDFKTEGDVDVDEAWDRTFAGTWIAQHAWEYGFIQSYPEGAESVTCYSYEPWHYRYVGRELAAEIHLSGMTLREFLWQREEGS
jgi:D-alanyl-D-alanine carboxypeptidase